MRANKKILTLILLLFPFAVIAQKGLIRGTVYDDQSGETLPGVTIFLEGTSIGTITDLDGQFTLSAPVGSYDLRVSFISFETLNIPQIEVKDGEVTLFDNLRLKEAVVGLEEVTVTATMVRNTESALMTVKRKSPNLVDGISSSSLKKIGDSDAASSMKRVPGVSVEGGKYVFVRGLGDRYTKTMLNGTDIPGLDPDRNTLQMDIFPTNLIDNIIVHKSFTPELPADFTGGMIDIETKEFPEEKKGSLSFSGGYNPTMHFVDNYVTYPGGSTDFLGFDDGTRSIPATENIPFFSEVVANPNGDKGTLYRNILGSFNPNLAALRQMSFMDYSLGYAMGDQKSGEKITIGYNLAFSYKNSTEFLNEAEYGRYGLSGDPDVMEMDRREYQVGDFGSNSVLLTGMGGMAFKTQASKVTLNLMHLQNGETRAGIFDYISADQGSAFYGFQHNLEYSQRSLTNLLLSGKHQLAGRTWELVWKLAPTLSVMNDPDIRFTRYENRDGVLSIGTEVGFPERIWRDLSEYNLSGVVHATRTFNFRERDAKIRFGLSHTTKERTFDVRSFALNIRSVPLTGNPNELFFEQNLWPLGGSISKGTTFEAPFFPVNPNQFDATIMNTGGYLSAELEPLAKMKTIVGVRVENYVQRYTGQDQLGYNVLNNEKVLEDLGFFPSLNLIYAIREKQNLRISYTKTIARPSFKELSYAEIFDPVTGRTFIGGLFRDANDFAGVEYWDGNLVSTNIHNFDMRWELYQMNGQMISVSGFYKKFIQPIEMVQFATQNGSFQPRNVGDATVLGAEVEMRQGLGFITGALKDFMLTANLTLTESRIELSETEYQSRSDNARTGQEVSPYRDMAGQAPYIVNAGFAYDGGEQEGFLNELEAGLYYNVQGETLQFVGMVDRPDIYAKPFHSLNFNANKKFGKENRIGAGVKLTNILNDKKEAIYRSFQASEQYFSRLDPGILIQFRFSYDLF